jgi:hypothetical protein
MPDKSEMSDSENEDVRASDEEDLVNQELENLKNDSPSPQPQVSGNKPFAICPRIYSRYKFGNKLGKRHFIRQVYLLIHELLKSLFFLAATRVLFNFIPTGLFA